MLKRTVMIGEMSDKIIWCFIKHFSPSNGAEKLADIINAEYFENAVIKRIWS